MTAVRQHHEPHEFITGRSPFHHAPATTGNWPEEWLRKLARHVFSLDRDDPVRATKNGDKEKNQTCLLLLRPPFSIFAKYRMRLGYVKSWKLRFRFAIALAFHYVYKPRQGEAAGLSTENLTMQKRTADA